MAIKIQVRRGTAANWTSTNPTLSAGELGFETDTGKVKVGTGSATWTALPYVGAISTTDNLTEGTTNKYFTDQRAVTAVGGASANTADALVKRDAQGNFSAGTVSAILNGNVVSTNAVNITSSQNLVLGGTGVYVGSVTTGNKAATEGYVDGVQDDLQANIDGHASDTSTHGVTQIVGTSETQTLSNKTMGSNLAMGNNKITGLGTPTDAADAVTKAYVDGLSESLNIHDAVKAATTANITISTALVAGQVIDGVTLASTNRVLVKNQTTESQNGIYVVQATGAAVRASDYNSVPEVEVGDFIFVTSGTVNASTGYVQTAVVTTIDTDPITFVQFSGAGTFLAGNGLTLTGSTFSINTDITATKTYADGVASTALSSAISDTQTRISNHNTTLNIHGIADTANLATISYVDTKVGTDVPTAVNTHAAVTTSVHGISNTANLIYNDNAALTNTRTPTDGSVTTAKIAAAGIAQSAVTDLVTDLGLKAPKADPTFTGTVAGITKSMVGLGNVDNTSDANKPVSTAQQTAIDAKLSLAGGTMTGKITLDGDPTQSLHAVTKQYVDNVEAGLKAKPSVVAATTANLTADYANGTSGVGATLTGTANGAFPQIDGVSVTTVNGQRGVLVKNQTNAAHNGRYNLTTQGDAGTKWVLTRCTLCDQASEIPGAYVFVTDGTLNGQTGWVQHVDDPATFVIGTDDIDVFQFAGAGTVTAGTNVSVSGNQVSVVAAPTFSGLVTASATGVAFSDGTQTKIGVPSITTISQKTDSYTLSNLNERDVIIEISKGSAATLTIPADSTVDYPVGTTLDIIQTNSGQVTIAGAGGVTVNATPGLKLRTQWSSATLLKRASNTWLVFGDLTA